MNEKCYLCPNKCGRDRAKGPGVCGASGLKVAHAAPHFYEEPPISGTNGSGAVFFQGCPLACIFCQNHPVSQGNYGKEISVKRLSEIFVSLQNMGCHNINLVSPTPYVEYIKAALDMAELEIPVVYNTSGYERAEVLKGLCGYVDVYLPDIKYVSPHTAGEYSGRENYPEYAFSALEEMLLQKPVTVLENGLIKSGVIVRHLVLPGHRRESMAVLDALKSRFGTEGYTLSLMSQYVPMHKAKDHPVIGRCVTSFEYRSVAEYAKKLGFSCFYQDVSSHTSEYTPDFDCQNI